MDDSKILERIQEIMRGGNPDELTAYLNDVLRADCTQAIRILQKLGMRPTLSVPQTPTVTPQGQDDEKSL